MKSTFRLLIMVAIALLISIPAAFAGTPEGSLLPVNEPLDVGGTILQPGTYLIRVLPSTADRNKVQITSQDRQTIYATLLTVPHALTQDQDVSNTVFVFYPAGEGMPRALRTWFAEEPSASQGGHDIVYSQSRAQQLARLSQSRVISYADATTDFDTAPLQIVTPEATLETYTYTPAPMMSSEPDSEPMEMPRTASRTPLIALLGLMSLAGAVAFRVARR